jgi:Ca-activated chloride channel homolog
MNFSEFEFAHPAWLYALLVPILVLLLARFTKRRFSYYRRIRQFADPHLLPHLQINQSQSIRLSRERLSFTITWIILWLLGVLALAGPRWDYEEEDVFRQRAQFMILLDLSESMRVQDLPHSRLEQALQDIEEILDKEENIDIGLMVFAGIPHLVAPLTDDYQTLRHLLYEIEIDLLPIQGSRLAPALETTARWLTGQSNSTMPHILLISDGEFEENDLKNSLAQLDKGEFILHTLGVGTREGSFIPVKDGTWQKDANGEVVISRLNEDTLRELAIAGQGIYQKATYRREDTQAILGEVERSLNETGQDKMVQKLWHERFYLLVGLMMLLILPWFRRQRTVLNQ